MSVVCRMVRLHFFQNARSFRPQFKKLSSGYVLSSKLPDVDIPNITISEYIFSKSENYGDRLIALECGLSGRKYTYKELKQKSKNLSKALRKKMGLREGDVVAVFLPNIPEYAIAALGILDAGLVVTTVNPLYTPEEVQRQFQDSSPKAIITLAELYQHARATCTLLKQTLPIITIKTKQDQTTPEKCINFSELVENIDHPEAKQVHPEYLAFLPYSSGTTGLPKGVQLTHRNLVANMEQCRVPELETVLHSMGSHQDVVPSVLPNFHAYGFVLNTLSSLSKGAKLITLPKFTSEGYINVLREHKPHFLFTVPPMVLFLSNHPRVKKQDLSSIRSILCAAAPLGALDEQRLIEKGGSHIHIVQGFGMTETTSIVAVSTPYLKRKFNISGSIGHPISNTSIKVAHPDDPTAAPLGPNTPGELLIKGPHLMKGYLNKPMETANAFVDEWMRTGDIGYYNDHKLIYITDRLKDLIKIKGFQVAPAELEEVIRDFPCVDDAAVIGVPHPSQGEAPRAYVVPKKNAKVNIRDLQEYVKSKVTSYKQLKGGVVIVESIPKSGTGKILRRNLKLQYIDDGKSRQINMV